MVKRWKFIVAGALLATVSTGCSKYATNGEHLYLKSQNGSGINVPPPLTNSNLSNFYRLPMQPYPNPKVDIQPPTFVGGV